MLLASWKNGPPIPKVSIVKPTNNKSINMKIINSNLFVSIEPIVMITEKIRYPKNANPNCFVSSPA